MGEKVYAVSEGSLDDSISMRMRALRSKDPIHRLKKTNIVSRCEDRSNPSWPYMFEKKKQKKKRFLILVHLNPPQKTGLEVNVSDHERIQKYIYMYYVRVFQNAFGRTTDFFSSPEPKARKVSL